MCSVAIVLGRGIGHVYGAQVDFSSNFLMWSVLGGDALCNQVTSLHEENRPTFHIQRELEAFFKIFYGWSLLK